MRKQGKGRDESTTEGQMAAGQRDWPETSARSTLGPCDANAQLSRTSAGGNSVADVHSLHFRKYSSQWYLTRLSYGSRNAYSIDQSSRRNSRLGRRSHADHGRPTVAHKPSHAPVTQRSVSAPYPVDSVNLQNPTFPRL